MLDSKISHSVKDANKTWVAMRGRHWFNTTLARALVERHWSTKRLCSN